MLAQGLQPALPTATAKHLADYLFEIGPTQQGGAIAVTEIAAWQSLSGITLLPWEAKQIRILSSIYAKQLAESRSQDCPAPHLDRKTIEKNREAVSNQLRINMRAYFLAKNN